MKKYAYRIWKVGQATPELTTTKYVYAKDRKSAEKQINALHPNRIWKFVK